MQLVVCARYEHSKNESYNYHKQQSFLNITSIARIVCERYAQKYLNFSKYVLWVQFVQKALHDDEHIRRKNNFTMSFLVLFLVFLMKETVKIVSDSVLVKLIIKNSFAFTEFFPKYTTYVSIFITSTSSKITVCYKMLLLNEVIDFYVKKFHLSYVE